MIPKTFKLLGREIKVTLEDELTNKNDARGESRYRYDEITLQSNVTGKPMTKLAQEHIFYHELVHRILYLMGEEELNDNEKFVDMFGGLLHQYFSTKK